MPHGGRGSPRASTRDGLLDGVVYFKPRQQAGDGKDSEHGGLRSGQGKAAALAADHLAMPDKHAEAGTVDEGQASEINDAARPCLPPDIAQISLQLRCAEKIRFTTQAEHGHVTAAGGW